MKFILRWFKRLLDIPLEWLCYRLLGAWLYVYRRIGLVDEAEKLEATFTETMERIKKRNRL